MTVTDDPVRSVPAHVYQERIAKVRAQCQERGLAGILLFDQASLYYLFGYDQLGYWVFQTVFLPADPALPPGAVCRAPDEHMIRATGLISDIRVWFDESPQTPGQLVTELLRDRGVKPGDTAGIELLSHALLPAYYQDLRDAAEGYLTLADTSHLVTDLRVVKDSYEVAWFREATVQLAAALRAARETVAPGVPETEVHRAVVEQLYRLGGDPPAIPPPIASGPRTLTQTHGAATGRRMRAGETVVIEVGAAAARYHAVGAVSYSLGRPQPEVAALYRAAAETLEEGFSAFVPGQPIADVSRRVQALLAERGFSRAGRHVGYGTGIGFPPTWLENLRIKATEPRTLVPGMTFFYFIGLPAADGSSIYLGEPVLITETGYERPATPAYADWVL